MLDGEGNEGAAKEGCKWVCVLGEAEQTGENVAELLRAGRMEQPEETAPSLAGLERPLPGVLVLRILGRGADQEPAQPSLEHKSRQVEIVLPLIAQGEGVFHRPHQRHWFEVAICDRPGLQFLGARFRVHPPSRSERDYGAQV